MDDAWRPDLSGILIIPTEVPPQFDGQFAVNLILTGQPDVLQSDKFASMLAGFIESGTATYLDVPRNVFPQFVPERSVGTRYRCARSRGRQGSYLELLPSNFGQTAGEVDTGFLILGESTTHRCWERINSSESW